MYRTSLANLIKASAHADDGVQIIATTFKPEIVGVADTIIGVTMENKVSTVREMSKAAALDFVLAQEPAAVLGATAAGGGGSVASALGKRPRTSTSAAREN